MLLCFWKIVFNPLIVELFNLFFYFPEEQGGRTAVDGPVVVGE
jgi:hypothetical protein